MKRIVALAAMLCLVSVPALAARPANYVVVKAGGYSPEDTDMNEFSSGFNGELAIGHYFNPNVVGEIGVGYFETDASFSGFDPVLGAYSESDEITVYPVTVTVKGVAPLPGGELYLGAGLGAYFSKARSDLFAAALGHESTSASDTAFGGHVVAGGNFDITPYIYVGAEVKYLWTRPSFSATFFGVPLTLDAPLDGLVATGNLGFRF